MTESPPETLEENVAFLHRLPGLELQGPSNPSLPSHSLPASFQPTMADIASLFTSDVEDLSKDHHTNCSVSLSTSHSSLFGSEDDEGEEDKGALTDLSLLSDEEVPRVNKVRVPRLPSTGIRGGRGRRRKRRSHRYSFQSRPKSQPKTTSEIHHAPTPTNPNPRMPFGQSSGPPLNRPKPPFSVALR